MKQNSSLITPLTTPSKEVLGDVVELFKHLCQWTVPYGYEDDYYGRMLDDLGWKRDVADSQTINYVLDLRNGEPSGIFCAHLDTVGDEPEPINLLIDGATARTDGGTILGADDRAGVAIVLYLAHVAKLPALYLLFSGEEKGRQGSSRWVGKHGKALQGLRFAIQVDRRNETEIITHQSGEECASDVFAEALARGLDMGHKPSNKGAYTDTFELRHHVPECVNIAAGYRNPHQEEEEQNLDYLARLCERLARLDYGALPIKRGTGA